jgi:hypothetical protein
VPYSEVCTSFEAGKRACQTYDFRELAVRGVGGPVPHAVEPTAEHAANEEFAAVVENKSQLQGKTHS